MGLSGRVAALAVHRRLPWLLAGLVVLLLLPSLNAGFLIDDYWHQNILSGKTPVERPLTAHGLFVFVDGEAAKTREMVDAGTLPWWTLDTLQLAFWRPLSELTHAVDHALAPDRPAVAHAQSLLWGAALAWLAALLYREVHGRVPAAGFAALVFALDDAHTFPLLWIAGRNALVAAAFGIAALLCHLRWCRRGWKPGAMLGPVCFLLALLGAEAAVAMLAYFVAYHAVIPSEPAGRELRRIALRFRPLLPYLVIALAYVVAYRLLGYGAHGSGQYLDPLGQPGAYAVEALPRAVLLLAGQLATLPFVLETFHNRDEIGRWIVLAIAALIVVLVARSLIAPRWQRPEVRFWLLGMLLALPPAMVLGAFSRVLMVVGIGGAGLLGVVFADWHRSAGVRPGWLSMLARRGFVAMHLVLAPLVLLGSAAVLPAALDLREDALAELPGEERPIWIFVNPRAAFWTGGNLQASRLHAGHSVPTIRALASGAFGVAVERHSERCLDVAPHHGYLFLTSDRLFRDPRKGMEVGWRRALSDVSIEVLEETPDGRPAKARFCFDRPLDDRTLRWVASVGSDWEVFSPPAIGESVRLDPSF